MTPGAWAAMTAWGRAPRGWARVRAGDTNPGVARVPSTAAPATASCNPQAIGLSSNRHASTRGTPKPALKTTHLSRDLSCGRSSGHSSSRWEASRGGRCKQGHGGSDGLAHPQVLAPQIKEVHGRHSILGRLSFLILCRAGRVVSGGTQGTRMARPALPALATAYLPMKP